MSKAAYNLIQNVQKVSSLNPFPMTEFKNIQEATTGMMLYLNNKGQQVQCYLYLQINKDNVNAMTQFEIVFSTVTIIVLIQYIVVK